MYIGTKNVNIDACVKGILETVDSLNFKSALIPYSSQLGDFSQLLINLIDQIGKCKHITEVGISTNNGK